MRTIAIGDIHGTQWWKKIVDSETYDKVIFMGDYFDSFSVPGEVQLNNFYSIVEFAINSGKEAILLVGNHEFHYMPEGGCDEYSGYNARWAPHFATALQNNRDLLKPCHVDQGILYSHAGVTDPWLCRHKVRATTLKGIERAVCRLWETKPEAFRFYPQDWTGTGNHPLQGPLWVRPNTLLYEGVDLTQVVGHTPQASVYHGGDCWFIDTMEYGDGSYLVVEDGTIKISNYTKS